MPSVSKKQARFMAAAAHNPKFAKKAGIKRSVAKEFNRADAGTGILKKAVGGAISRAMGYAPKPGVVGSVVQGALSQIPRRGIPTPPKGPAIASSKGQAFRGRNAGPVKPDVITEADNTLNETGGGLRRTIGRLSSRVLRRKEGGKVATGLSALAQLAKKYREALDMEDTETAARIKRQMERLKKGSSKDVEPDEEAVGADKAATFSEGGKVSKLRAAMKAVRAHGYRLRKVDNEYQIRPDEKSWDDDTTYYTNDLDDAVSTAQAERKAMNRQATK